MSTIKSNEEWMSIIQECRASGFTDRQWCRDHKISVSTFYYNIRKLRNLACEIPGPFVSDPASTTQEVVPLRFTNEEDEVALSSNATRQFDPLSIVIECDDISVTCPDGISSATISSVIYALQKKC